MYKQDTILNQGLEHLQILVPLGVLEQIPHDTERQLYIFHENCSRTLKLLFRIMKVFLFFFFPRLPTLASFFFLAIFSAKKATDVKHIRWGI